MTACQDYVKLMRRCLGSLAMERLSSVAPMRCGARHVDKHRPEPGAEPRTRRSNGAPRDLPHRLTVGWYRAAWLGCRAGNFGSSREVHLGSGQRHAITVFGNEIHCRDNHRSGRYRVGALGKIFSALENKRNGRAYQGARTTSGPEENNLWSSGRRPYQPKGQAGVTC